jgi:glycerol-3-phosphate dehydrogenase (NAD(P)+)
MKAKQHPIAVLGAGSWGTALAMLLARNGYDTRLWTRDQLHAKQMHEDGENNRYLPDYPFPKSIHVYHDLAACLEGVTDIFVVVPSYAFRELITKIKPYTNHGTRLVWGTKGLDAQNQLLHEVVEEILQHKLPMAVLSGPSLAGEVAAGLPTAVTVSSNDERFAHDLIAYLHSVHFRVYQNNDMIGVELCGAIKNVLAIASGISDGMQFGSNARSALITRGLAEMSRLCEALGGQKETVMGLAGLGDLVLTSTDNQSRNRRFGMALGTGIDPKTAEQAIGQAVEGFHNSQQVCQLAKKHRIEMPISQQVYRILHDNLDARKAVQELLERAPKTESSRE